MKLRGILYIRNRLKRKQLSENELRLKELFAEIEIVDLALLEGNSDLIWSEHKVGKATIRVCNQSKSYNSDSFYDLEQEIARERVVRSVEFAELLFQKDELLRRVKAIRRLNKLIKIQIGFFNYTIIPLFKDLHKHLRRYCKNLLDDPNGIDNKLNTKLTYYSKSNYMAHYEKSRKIAPC